MIGALIAKKKTASAYKSLNNRDISSFLAVWHDEATWIYPGHLSISGEFKGKQTIEEWFRKYLDRFTDIKITPKSICAKPF